MTRYLADQNKVVLLQESGTYGSSSGTGIWVGQVQSFTLDDTENPMMTRYLGNASRSIAAFDVGPQDVTGTISYNPQDMLLFSHILGSVYSASGTNSTHTATEIDSDVMQNPFISGTCNTTPWSFTMEDSKTVPGTGTNFIRTVKGCVPNTATLKLTQSEKASIDVNFIAQSVSYSSGSTTSVTEKTNKAYIWGDATITLSGTSLQTTKDISLEVNQNIVGPHYINGSRVIGAPYPGNRDYTLSVTADVDTTFVKKFYEGLFKGGSTFNGDLLLNHVTAAGSQYANIAMSGCLITSFAIPSNIEGINEVTMTIRPQILSMTVYDRYNSSYNPW